jgi:polysaccharide biosynthesis/export protein
MKMRRKSGIALITILLSGCTASSDSAVHPASGTAALSSVAATHDRDIPGADNANDRRLAQIWKERSTKLADFPIGPGDLLEVSVPGIDQLQNRTARVGGDGHIYLPLAGDLPVAGETEGDIREQLNQRMEKYLYNPQTNIFVKSYASRQVAVMGAVGHPGMYVLNGPEDTVWALLERAGGIDDHAAHEIVLTPGGMGQQSMMVSREPQLAELRGPDAEANIALNHPASDGRVDQMGDTSHFRPIDNFSPPARNAESVVINLVSGNDEARYGDLPVRPGDTISVPTAGSVTVVGWVYSPKTIPITPGLTVLGAVSAAGGALFAGNTKTVKLIRQKADGQSETMIVNLDEVQKHKAPNTPVEANDIVDVPYTAIRLPGYALYYAMLGIVQYGPMAAMSGS